MLPGSVASDGNRLAARPASARAGKGTRSPRPNGEMRPRALPSRLPQAIGSGWAPAPGEIGPRKMCAESLEALSKEIVKAWPLALDADLTQYSVDGSGELPGQVPQLRRVRDEMNAARQAFILPERATEQLRPFHAIIAESVEYRPEEVLASMPCRQRPRENEGPDASLSMRSSPATQRRHAERTQLTRRSRKPFVCRLEKTCTTCVL